MNSAWFHSHFPARVRGLAGGISNPREQSGHDLRAEGEPAPLDARICDEVTGTKPGRPERLGPRGGGPWGSASPQGAVPTAAGPSPCPGLGFTCSQRRSLPVKGQAVGLLEVTQATSKTQGDEDFLQIHSRKPQRK